MCVTKTCRISPKKCTSGCCWIFLPFDNKDIICLFPVNSSAQKINSTFEDNKNPRGFSALCCIVLRYMAGGKTEGTPVFLTESTGKQNYFGVKEISKATQIASIYENTYIHIKSIFGRMDKCLLLRGWHWQMTFLWDIKAIMYQI